MTVYAESSAVLAWLFGEDAGDDIRPVLEEAERIVASDLTTVEVLRGLGRVLRDGLATEGEGAERRGEYRRVSAQWTFFRLDGPVLERAARPFPGEPVRTLDALHLATALGLREAGEEVTVLSLDRRVRANAEALGLDVAP